MQDLHIIFKMKIKYEKKVLAVGSIVSNQYIDRKIEEAEKRESKKDNLPSYYDNSNGSIYEFCNNQNLNAWEFDLIKRIARCRKKGNFVQDLEKTKALIDLYLKEYGQDK